MFNCPASTHWLLSCALAHYKYEGMLAHPFDRFYVVPKFILPSIGDLKFSTLNYDNACAYSDSKNVHDTDSKNVC